MRFKPHHRIVIPHRCAASVPVRTRRRRAHGSDDGDAGTARQERLLIHAAHLGLGVRKIAGPKMGLVITIRAPQHTRPIPTLPIEKKIGNVRLRSGGKPVITICSQQRTVRLPDTSSRPRAQNLAGREGSRSCPARAAARDDRASIDMPRRPPMRRSHPWCVWGLACLLLKGSIPSRSACSAQLGLSPSGSRRVRDAASRRCDGRPRA